MTLKKQAWRKAWVVESDGGFIGTRRYTYAQGSHHKSGVPFTSARIFTRRQDAELNCGSDDRVREVTIYLWKDA